MKKVDVIEDIILTEQQQFIFNDEIRYKQILLNLLGNALKCTSKGYIKVRLAYSPSDDAILTEVQDTGSGISKEKQKKLFQMYQEGQDDKHQHSVGLGLSITKTLVGLIGPKNSLKVKSEEQKGSTFSFLMHRSLEGPGNYNNYNNNFDNSNNLLKIRNRKNYLSKSVQVIKDKNDNNNNNNDNLEDSENNS